MCKVFETAYSFKHTWALSAHKSFLVHFGLTGIRLASLFLGWPLQKYKLQRGIAMNLNNNNNNIVHFLLCFEKTSLNYKEKFNETSCQESVLLFFFGWGVTPYRNKIWLRDWTTTKFKMTRFLFALKYTINTQAKFNKIWQFKWPIKYNEVFAIGQLKEQQQNDQLPTLLWK